MKRSPGNELTLCLRAIALAAVASLAACGGGAYSNGRTPEPVTTSGTAVIYPQSPSVPVGGTIDFLANQPGQSSTTFKWTVTGSGTIDPTTGIYTAGTTPATATVTATSGSFVGTTTVAVTAAVQSGVTMSPAALFVEAGSTVPISASAGGKAATVTEWDVNGTANGDTLHGTIDNSGNYTAPLTPPPGGTTTITAKTAAGAANTIVTVVFSNQSLDGPYAFSYAGEDSKGVLEAAGSFMATGTAGTISNMVEDVAAADIAPKTISAGTGTFKVGPDGTTQATISDGSTWEFVLTGNSAPDAGMPAQEALLIRFDKSGTGSGTINQQDPATVDLPMPAGPYTFDLSETGTIGKIFEAAGKFQSSGLIGNSGALTPGVWDTNAAGSVDNDDTSLAGSFAPDPLNPGTGRGTLVLTTTRATIAKESTFNFAFYVVDATHLKLIETDGAILSAGDIFDAPNTNGSFSTASLKGNYPFTTDGASNSGPYSQGGIFVSNGSGDITSGVMDVNAGVGGISLVDTISQTSYTVDPSLGRIQFSLTATQDGKTVGTWDFAGYQTSSGALVMVETDTVNVQTVVLGTAYLQNSTTGLQGSYAANFTSIKGSTQEEDVVGQFVVSNTAVSTGTLNSNLLSSGLSTGVPVTQAVVTAPITGGRGTATIDTQSESFPLVYYVIDQNTALVLESDAVRSLVGTVVKQF